MIIIINITKNINPSSNEYCRGGWVNVGKGWDKCVEDGDMHIIGSRG